VAVVIFRQTAVSRETKGLHYHVIMSENGLHLCLKIPGREINYRLIPRPSMCVEFDGEVASGSTIRRLPCIREVGLPINMNAKKVLESQVENV
jgi:hypothetical protein